MQAAVLLHSGWLAVPVFARASMVPVPGMRFCQLKSPLLTLPALPCPALPQNMLVCAPTGAGKTNVAMLTMLHEIGLHRWARWAGGGCTVLCCARWR